jgi:hypothetical protein
MKRKYSVDEEDVLIQPYKRPRVNEIPEIIDEVLVQPCVKYTLNDLPIDMIGIIFAFYAVTLDDLIDICLFNKRSWKYMTYLSRVVSYAVSVPSIDCISFIERLLSNGIVLDYGFPSKCLAQKNSDWIEQFKILTIRNVVPWRKTTLDFDFASMKGSGLKKILSRFGHCDVVTIQRYKFPDLGTTKKLRTKTMKAWKEVFSALISVREIVLTDCSGMFTALMILGQSNIPSLRTIRFVCTHTPDVSIIESASLDVIANTPPHLRLVFVNQHFGNKQTFRIASCEITFISCKFVAKSIFTLSP